MQVKFRRSNGQKGMLMKHPTYIVDVTILPAQDEQQELNQFALLGNLVWSHTGEPAAPS